MRNLKLIFSTFLLLTFVNIYAHKDRIESPNIYVLYFENERVEIKSSEKTKLESYNELIVSKKKKLTHADLVFTTGEVISFDFNDYQCTKIEIEFMKKTLLVPSSEVKKITGINLLTVSLLWSGDKPQAFDSEYFYITFSIGKSELPYLQFSFTANKFSEAVIWRKVDENSSQWKKL